VSRLALALLTAPLALTIASCAHASADVGAPDRAGVLVLAADRQAPAPAERVVLGASGAVLLAEGGGFASTFADGPRAGVRAARGASHWIDGVEIDAFDGDGRWLLALDDHGTIQRLRGGGAVEPMNARLSVPPRVLRMRAAGDALAVLTGDALFVADRRQVSRIDVRGRELAASRSAVAVIADAGVLTIDLATHGARSFAFDDPRAVALTPSGTLVVATDRAIYRENGSGELVLRYVAGDGVRALATEDERIWFADGARVGVLEGDGARLTGALGDGLVTQVAATARDVWIVQGGKARRFAREAEAFPPDLERIAASACVPCHRDERVEGGGPFDLSTVSAFRTHRDAIVRVLAAGTMPPAGRPLSSGDRARLLEWTRSR
jgi:hypothetical protein